MMPKIKISSTVHVRLFDGRKVVGEVKAVWDSVSGPMVRVHSGDLVLTVNADQVIEVR
jgi:hypothetical protein